MLWKWKKKKKSTKDIYSFHFPYKKKKKKFVVEMRRKKINKDIYSFDFPYKINKKMFKIGKNNYIRICNGSSLLYQSQVSILGPVGYGPTTLPLRHSDWLICIFFNHIYTLFLYNKKNAQFRWAFGLFWNLRVFFFFFWLREFQA